MDTDDHLYQLETEDLKPRLLHLVRNDPTRHCTQISIHRTRAFKRTRERIIVTSSAHAQLLMLL